MAVSVHKNVFGREIFVVESGMMHEFKCTEQLVEEVLYVKICQLRRANDHSPHICCKKFCFEQKFIDPASVRGFLIRVSIRRYRNYVTKVQDIWMFKTPQGPNMPCDIIKGSHTMQMFDTQSTTRICSSVFDRLHLNDSKRVTLPWPTLFESK